MYIYLNIYMLPPTINSIRHLSSMDQKTTNPNYYPPLDHPLPQRIRGRWSGQRLVQGGVEIRAARMRLKGWGGSLRCVRLVERDRASGRLTVSVPGRVQSTPPPPPSPPKFYIQNTAQNII